MKEIKEIQKSLYKESEEEIKESLGKRIEKLFGEIKNIEDITDEYIKRNRGN